MDAFVTARQPWSEYISLISKEDAEVIPTEMNEGPLYRGRQRGREGSLLKEGVQLHYRRYPDEHVIANLTRWRSGDLVGDIALQQFRGAQPFVIDMPDESGLNAPAPELYLKLNYKNPAVLSTFLTRTGHFYPRHVKPINPYALTLLRTAVWRSRHLGFFPKFGNPFWQRAQADRPKAYQGEYDPSKAHVKSTLEQFAYNWLQTHRIKQHFKRDAAQRAASGGAAQTEMQSGGYESRAEYPRSAVNTDGIGFSQKVTTVPGMVAINGLRRNNNLYSRASKRRMGFPNPLGTMKKL